MIVWKAIFSIEDQVVLLSKFSYPFPVQKIPGIFLVHDYFYS